MPCATVVVRGEIVEIIERNVSHCFSSVFFLQAANTTEKSIIAVMAFMLVVYSMTTNNHPALRQISSFSLPITTSTSSFVLCLLKENRTGTRLGLLFNALIT